MYVRNFGYILRVAHNFSKIIFLGFAIDWTGLSSQIEYCEIVNNFVVKFFFKEIVNNF